MSNENIMFRVGKETGEAVASVVNALADKKVRFGEGVTMAKEIGTLGVLVARSYKEIGHAFSDGFTEQEEEELKEGFCEGFNLDESQTEEKVEAYFDVALEILSSIARLFIKASDD